jgi:hypothetical protein
MRLPDRSRDAAVLLPLILLAGCETTAKIESNTALDHSKHVRRLVVMQSLSYPRDFQSKFGALLDACGIASHYVAPAPRPLESLALDDDTQDDEQFAAETAKIVQFRPDAALRILQTSQGTSPMGKVHAAVYALRLYDPAMRKDLWRAIVVLQPAWSDPAETLSNTILHRMVADGVLRCGNAA